MLTCGCCHSTMTPAASQGHGTKRYYYTSIAAKMYGHHKCTNGAVPLAAMDECMIKIVSQLFQDPKVFQALIERVAPNKTMELLRVLRTPEKVFYKLADRYKLLLMRLLITGVTVNYETIEINWTDLGLSLLPENLLQNSTGHQTVLPMPFIPPQHFKRERQRRIKTNSEPFYTAMFRQAFIISEYDLSKKTAIHIKLPRRKRLYVISCILCHRCKM